MILTIYRIRGMTIEVKTNQFKGKELVSGEVFELKHEGKTIKFRPYYRLYKDGILNVFAEEDY